MDMGCRMSLRSESNVEAELEIVRGFSSGSATRALLFRLDETRDIRLDCTC